METSDILVCKNCGTLSDRKYVKRVLAPEESSFLMDDKKWICGSCKELNEEEYEE